MSFYGNITTSTVDFRKIERFFNRQEILTMIRLLARNNVQYFLDRMMTMESKVFNKTFLYVKDNYELKKKLYFIYLRDFIKDCKLNSIEVDIALFLVLFYFQQEHGKLPKNQELRCFNIFRKRTLSPELVIKTPKNGRIFTPEDVDKIKCYRKYKQDCYINGETRESYQHNIEVDLNNFQL